METIKTVKRLSGLVAALLAICLSANADTTLFTSAFYGNSGATVLSGLADNTSGATTLTINDWTTNAAVTSISGLTVISTPTPAGGFAVLETSTSPVTYATYANPNCVFVNCNLNVNQSTCQRGYSFTFTVNSAFNLTTVNVVARHTNNSGLNNQGNTSDLHYSISGGTLGTPLSNHVTIVYPTTPGYTNVQFSLGNASIGAGTYTVQVYESNLVGGGAYATYQGITLAGNPPGLTLAPTFTPAAGSYAAGQTVTISSATAGASIYYTTNGTTPTTSSPNGITPVTVVLPANTNLTIQAFAQASGYTASSVASATYSTYTNYTWINTAGGNWSTAANWTNNAVANGVGTPADFSELTLGGSATVTLNTPITVGSLTFGDQANANSWTLANGGAGPLTLNNGTNTSVIVVNNQTTTISAVLAGTNGLVKSGSGTLVLTNANTFSGGTTVNGGLLALDYNLGDNPTGTLKGGNAVTVNANGTLRLDIEDALGYNGGIPSALNINGGLVTSADVANSTPVNGSTPGGTSFRVTLPTVNFQGGTLSSGANQQGDNYGGCYLLNGVNTYSNSATAVINAYSLSFNNGDGTFTVAAGNTPSGVDLEVSSLLGGWFGGFSLTKAGAGVMELDQSSTPTAVNVNAGTLFLNGTFGNCPITVAANATFLASGSVGGAITVATGGTFGVGYTTINTLSSYSTVTFNSGSTNYMKISKNGGSAQSDQVINLSSVTFAGTLVVSNITSDGHAFASGDTFSFFPPAVSAPYSGNFSSEVLPALPVGLGWDVSQLNHGIITVSSSAAPPTFSPLAGGYAGALTVTISSLTPGATIYYTTDGSTPTTSSPHGTTPVSVGLPANTNLTIQAFAVESGYSASSVESAAYTTYANYVWVNPAGGTWSTTGNWTNNAVPNGVGTPADFSELTLSGDTTAYLDTPVTVGSLVFGDQGNAHNWILADGGGGPLTLNNGTNAPTIAVNNQTTTVSAVLAGSSGFVKAGSGTLVLDNANVNSGPVVVGNGTVALNYNPGDSSTGTLAAGTTNTVNAGGKLLLNVQDVLGYGSGNTAQLNINGGLVTTADVATNTTVQNGGPSYRVTLPPVTFTGGTLSSGTNNEGDNYGGSYLMSSVNTFSNATTAVIDAYKISIIAGSSSVFNVAAGSTPSGVDLSVSSILQNWGGNFNLVKAGSGVMTLSGVNTYTGGTSVRGGTLNLANVNAPGANGTSLYIDATANIELSTDTGFGGVNPVYDVGLYNNGPYQGTMILNRATPGASTPITHNFGALTLSLNGGAPTALNVLAGPNAPTGGAVDTLAFASVNFGNWYSVTETIAPTNVNVVIGSGAAEVSQGSASPQVATLDLDGTSVGNEITGAIVDNASGNTYNAAAILKSNSSTWTLSGANTYTGNTTINGGTLALAGSGSIANSPNIIIAGGATFDVSGLSSPFALGSSQTLNSSSTAVFKGNGSAVTGTLTLNYTNGMPALTVSNGTLTLSSSTVFQINNFGSQLTGGTYTLISKSGGGAVAGTVPTGAITVGGGGAASTANLTITNGQLNLVVASSVNTNPTNITATASSGNLNLSWPADHTGWRLLVQTNHLSSGVSTNPNDWTTVIGSSATNQVSIPIVTTNRDEFYRMVYP